LARDPHLALREVERVLMPEGRVVIVGFNPASLWGLRQHLGRWRRRLLPNSSVGLFLPSAGDFLRYRRLPTRLAVVDPEGSSFFPSWRDGDPSVATGRPSRIEGIGRPRVEPSFVPTIVDRMICVPDAASLAAMRHLERVTGRRAGGSTGTNLWGAFRLVAEMLADGRTGSVVTLLCDGGERYAHTYYSDAWLAAEGLDLGPYAAALQGFTATGRWTEPA